MAAAGDHTGQGHFRAWSHQQVGAQTIDYQLLHSAQKAMAVSPQDGYQRENGNIDVLNR